MASIVTDTTNTTTSAISGQDILNEIINYKNNGNEEYKQILKYMKKLVMSLILIIIQVFNCKLNSIKSKE